VGKVALIASRKLEELPVAYQKDLHRAVKILRAAECTDIYLFGSLAGEQIRPDSDIDLAIRGCPQGKFFELIGQLLFELDHPVDLICLDHQDAFATFLEEHGELIRLDSKDHFAN
jgi:predicted nucleotidyltransferase